MAEHSCRTRVIRSTVLDPWMNLAYEEFLFDSVLPGEHILFLWRNSESVVIGRYQNPWIECRLQDMKNDGIGLARRFSGGGAVFHDPGNLNFTFITDAGSYDRQRDFDIILSALQNTGIAAELNDRNDIIVDGRKVSGSAYKLTRSRACHHGTLLVSADLDRLRRYLRPRETHIESRGIKSVRSEVVNLSEVSEAVDSEGLRDTVADSFFELLGPGESLKFSGTATDAEALAERYSRLRDPGWIYGKCPEFTHQIRGNTSLGEAVILLKISAAAIVDADITIDLIDPAAGTAAAEAVGGALRGKGYFRQALPSPDELVALVSPSARTAAGELLSLIASEIPEI